jgi:pectinesterase
MKPHILFAFAAALVVPGVALATPKLRIVVANPAALARPAETITVPWTAIARAIPGALLQHLAVRDADGASLPYQVTNVNPEAKDPSNLGVAYGELIFQHDFAAGEKTARFTVEAIEAVAPVFPAKVFARFVPERYDDFAWENDKIGHRTYGPALAAPDTNGSGKEVTVSSGIDIWCKKVNYLIVDRWYNKGHTHYHHDEGEGMDMYNVGLSRGDGGIGIWDGRTLAVSGNFQKWKVIANGPIRAIFELDYDAWTAQGAQVTEVKRYTVDAGNNFDQIDSTVTVIHGSIPALTIGIGLGKDSADHGEDPRSAVTARLSDGALSLWTVEKTHGSLGTAFIVSPESLVGFAEDKLNHLALVRAESGKPLRFYAGAAWSKAGEITTQQSWNDYVAARATRLRHPVTITTDAIP